MASTSNFIGCQICFEKYNKSCRAPNTIPCGHTLCKFCLKMTRGRAKSQQLSEFQCPFCRHPISLYDRFQRNYQLIEILDQSGQLEKDDVSNYESDDWDSASSDDECVTVETQEASEEDFIDNVVPLVFAILTALVMIILRKIFPNINIRVG